MEIYITQEQESLLESIQQMRPLLDALEKAIREKGGRAVLENELEVMGGIQKAGDKIRTNLSILEEMDKEQGR